MQAPFRVDALLNCTDRNKRDRNPTYIALGHNFRVETGSISDSGCVQIRLVTAGRIRSEVVS
jgi:hypothetical protein